MLDFENWFYRRLNRDPCLQRDLQIQYGERWMIEARRILLAEYNRFYGKKR